MESYRSFGLTVRSEIPLPCPPVDGDPPDVTIAREELSRDMFDSRDADEIVTDASEVGVQLPAVGRFVVRRGTSIGFDPTAGSSSDDIRAYLLGSVLGILLHQRAVLALHATTVARDGRGIALAGHRGRGKSTLAGALIARGWRLVSDDKTTPHVDGTTVRYQRGPSVLKLHPGTAKQLDAPLEAASPPLPTAKRWYRAPAVEQHRGPISTVYILVAGSDPGVEEMGAPDQHLALLQHVYRPAFVGLNGTLDGFFHTCAEISRHVPVKRLTVPRGLSRLDEFCETIERDLA